MLETHIVKNVKGPIRLQEYAVDIFRQIPTKSSLKKAIKKQQIYVNGNVATTAIFINDNDRIDYCYCEEKSRHKKLNLTLNVLYEDQYFAIVHKPAGILVSGNSYKTIENALTQNLKKSILYDSCKPHPVHRLDYQTTGALLVGKTKSSIRAFNNMFNAKKIKKTYLAITVNELGDSGKITTQVNNKTAISYYTKLKSVFSKRFKELNLVKLKLETGRRHQLRKHLLSLNSPILGDQTYYKHKNLVLKGKGLYLHAYSLEFCHPFTGEKIIIKDRQLKRFCKIFKDQFFYQEYVCD